jgi:NAD(P)-dependent dehydrogenase (short-subunit alcohol dehydrogenase family)
MKHIKADRVVLITGGTGGIGKATAIGLATIGARVGITCRAPRGDGARPLAVNPIKFLIVIARRWRRDAKLESWPREPS